MSNYVSTHWGTYKFSLDENKKIKLDHWELDSSPTDFGLGLADAAVDELRIKQPFVRKGWIDNNCKGDGNRGRDDFGWNILFNCINPICYASYET